MIKFVYILIIFTGYYVTCGGEKGIYLPIGLENGGIPNEMIESPIDASNPGYEGHRARLNNEKAWCTSSFKLSGGDVFKEDQYVEIKFLKSTTINIVKLQGWGNYGYGNQIRLKYELGKYYNYRKNGDKNIAVKNKRGDNTEDLELYPPISATAIRIYLQYGSSTKCLRLELYKYDLESGSDNSVGNKTEINSDNENGEETKRKENAFTVTDKTKIMLSGIICSGVLICLVFVCIIMQWKRRKNILKTEAENANNADTTVVHLDATNHGSDTVSNAAQTSISITQSANTPTTSSTTSRTRTNTKRLSKKRLSSHIYASISSFIFRKWSRQSSNNNSSSGDDSKPLDHQYENTTARLVVMTAADKHKQCHIFKPQEIYEDMDEGTTTGARSPIVDLRSLCGKDEDVFYDTVNYKDYQPLQPIDPNSSYYENRIEEEGVYLNLKV